MEIDILREFGFPVAVAAWALWSGYKHELFLQETLEKTIKENTQAIQSLADYIKAWKKGDKENDARRSEETD